MDINEAVAAQLRAERAIARLTMDEVAARGVISKRSLVRYEKAEREIPVPAVAVLAEVYGTTAIKIFNAAVARMTEAPADDVSPRPHHAERLADTTGMAVEYPHREHGSSPADGRRARGTTAHHKA